MHSLPLSRTRARTSVTAWTHRMRNPASVPIRGISALMRCKRHMKKQRWTYIYGAKHRGAAIARETSRTRAIEIDRNRERYIATASRLYPPRHNCRSRQCRVARVVLVRIFVELLQAGTPPHRTHAQHCGPTRSCPELRSNPGGCARTCLMEYVQLAFADGCI